MISDANKGKLAEMLSGRDASDRIFEWELSEDQMKDQMETYGFVYRCVVDNTSDPQQWMSFSGAIGRNVVEAIIGCHESHLLSGVVTVMYPELGMSPAMQAAFVWMVVRHPQASQITELRVMTRAPFLVSDAKSYNVRIINYEGRPGNHDSEYYAPKEKYHDKDDIIKRNRKDPYFTKGEKFGIFFNFAEKNWYGIYLGEDQHFVYWRNPGEGKIYRTDHKAMWYDLNAVLLDKEETDAVADMLFIGEEVEIKIEGVVLGRSKVEMRPVAEIIPMVRKYLKEKI